MTLIIGGAGQGKLDLALSLANCGREDIALTPQEAGPLLYRLETWLRTEPDPLPALEALLERSPDVVIVCSEVGCGVVPLDRGDRDWRERVGRTCCALARRADRVIRVCCGIPTTLKGA